LHFSSRMISSNASENASKRDAANSNMGRHHLSRLRSLLQVHLMTNLLANSASFVGVAYSKSRLCTISKRIKKKKCPVGNCRVRSVLKIYSAGKS
jgi:hypothetical protein